jgi:hypothetical protein
MMYLGLVLFLLTFILLAPQTRGYLNTVFVGLAAFMTGWAPYSYLLMLILLGALFAGLYLIHSWPAHVEPESPMAKYRREAPVEEE